MTQAPPLYALRLVAQGHYLIAKFTMPDFTVEATYNLTAKGSGYACDCPASARVVKYKPCKHQRMLPFMLGACNTDRFYEPESRSWCQPLAPDLAAAIAGEAGQELGANRVGEAVMLPTAAEIADFTANADGASKQMVPQAGLPKLRRRV